MLPTNMGGKGAKYSVYYKEEMYMYISRHM